MDEIYRFISTTRPVHLKPVPDCVEFKVTELWRQHSNGRVETVTKKITVNATQKWLAEETIALEGGDKKSLILRLVWTYSQPQPPSKDHDHVALPTKSAQAMLSKFGLELVYEYFQSTVTSVNAFPKVQGSDGSEHQAFAVCYAPKFAAIWSHQTFAQSSDRPPVTYGIILAGKDKRETLKSCLAKPWNEKVLTHALFPILVFGIMFDGENAHAVEEVRNAVQPVETRTGYTQFKTPRQAASAELGVLSAQMSGAATKLASVQRRSKALEKVIDFVLERVGQRKEGETQHTVSLTDPCSGDDLLRNHAFVLRQRHEMQVHDTTYTLKRVQVQIEALVNLIAQGDSMTNTDIALSSHRDASSMKTLAFVTMFFLPGSFVSALFSTNCFDWNEEKQKGSSSIGIGIFPQFSLYWAITLPLTVLTFILYWIWLRWQTRDREKRRKKQDNRVVKAVSDVEFSEVENITKRRETLLGEKSDKD